jgi:hypothetical protein
VSEGRAVERTRAAPAIAEAASSNQRARTYYNSCNNSPADLCWNPLAANKCVTPYNSAMKIISALFEKAMTLG